MQPIKEEKINSTMIPHHPSTDTYHSTPSPLNPSLNPSLNPNNTTITSNNVVGNEIINNNNIASTSYDVNNNNMDLEWDSEFPPGYRFCPKDGELIHHYLRKRILNVNLPHDKIKDVNLYATTPDKLSEEYEPVGDNEWYFFTPRDRKYKNGFRPNRAANRAEGGASSGYWKATGADKDIFDPRNETQVIGHKKALVFYEGKSPKGIKTNWIMHEFRVVKTTSTRKRLHDNDMRLDDWVLCRIYNKSEKSPKANVKQEVANEPNPETNDQETEGAEQQQQEMVISSEDEKVTPEEDHLLNIPHYSREDAIGGFDKLFEDYNPQIFYKNEFHRIVKHDIILPPHLHDLPDPFPDLKPMYDDDEFFYQHGFEDPEKKPYFPSMDPLVFLQEESPGENSSALFDEDELIHKFIASPNSPLGSDVVID